MTDDISIMSNFHTFFPYIFLKKNLFAFYQVL